MGNEGLYSVGKEMRKARLKKFQAKSFTSYLLAESRSDLQNTAW